MTDHVITNLIRRFRTCTRTFDDQLLECRTDKETLDLLLNEIGWVLMTLSDLEERAVELWDLDARANVFPLRKAA